MGKVNGVREYNKRVGWSAAHHKIKSTIDSGQKAISKASIFGPLRLVIASKRAENGAIFFSFLW
jgi:hypothetical protein